MCSSCSRLAEDDSNVNYFNTTDSGPNDNNVTISNNDNKSTEEKTDIGNSVWHFISTKLRDYQWFPDNFIE